jgi:hypothetical protein
MAIPKINGTDLWSVAIDKINDAIKRIQTGFTRTGKTLTLTADDGATINIELARGDNGVISGAQITQDVTDQRQFDITAGVIRLNDNELSVGSNSKTLANGDPTNPRIDALIFDAAGFYTIVAGVAAPVPLPPTIPAESIVMAYVWVEAGATSTVSDILLKPSFTNLSNGDYFKFNGDTVTVIEGVIQNGTPPPVKASQLETDTGTNDDKFITPLKLKNNTSQRADQATVDAGTNNTQFVTPLTLKNYTGFPSLQADYVEKFDLIAATSNNAWHVVAAGVGNDKIILISCGVSSGGANRFVGVRAVGSVLDRRLDLEADSTVTMTVKTDGSGDIEMFSENIANSNFRIISIIG